MKQYRAMMATEGIAVEFPDEALREICEFAAEVNTQLENIGARRLHTVLEKLLEEIAFDAPEMPRGSVQITREYVRERLGDIVKDRDLTRYIL